MPRANNFKTSGLRQTVYMLDNESLIQSNQVLDSELTIVIPTLNEEDGIKKVIEELQRRSFRNILVVDGHSRDQTVEVSSKFGVRTVYQKGKGKTDALLTAIENVSTPYMLVMDGDYSYDASSIAKLASYMNSYDEVIGARLPVSKQSMSRLHRFGNAVITRIFNALMGTNLTDVCSGMYIVRTAVAKNIQLSSSGFDLEAEIAAKIASTGRIIEVGVNYRPRIGRQKLSTWKHGFGIICSIFGLARLYNPRVYYAFLCTLVLIPATIILASDAIALPTPEDQLSPLVIAGVTMLLAGVQSMSLGIMSLLQRRSIVRLRCLEHNQQ